MAANIKKIERKSNFEKLITFHNITFCLACFRLQFVCYMRKKQQQTGRKRKHQPKRIHIRIGAETSGERRIILSSGCVLESKTRDPQFSSAFPFVARVDIRVYIRWGASGEFDAVVFHSDSRRRILCVVSLAREGKTRQRRSSEMYIAKQINMCDAYKPTSSHRCRFSVF